MDKKDLLLFFIFLCLATTSRSQKKIYQLKADTVRIFSSCDTAELILENRTRNLLNAALVNKGNGVTEFRKIVEKINDSLYIIGGDSIQIMPAMKNIYTADGVVTANRTIDGNRKNMRFKNNNSYLIANNAQQVIVSRTPVDSVLLNKLGNAARAPFTGLSVRGTGCDAAIELVSDSAGTCSEGQMIDFIALKPRSDSWLTNAADKFGDKHLLGRIELQTSREIAEYASLSFSVKSDTAFYHDGAYAFYPAGFVGGYMPIPIMSINPSFKHPKGYNTKMPFVQVNGGLFVGYGRNAYFNSRNVKDIITGVDDVAGYLQPFYETRFSVYADSLPLKIYKLPAIKGNAFLTYSPDKTVEGNNVAFEYKDSVYEDIRRYISSQGLGVPSDRRLKENITASVFSADKLLSLALMDFNYKADKRKTRYTGLIAQDLKLTLPELVTGNEGDYTIDYSKMVPYLLKALQDQQSQMNALKLQQQLAGMEEMKSFFQVMLPQLKELQQQVLLQQEKINSLNEQVKTNYRSIASDNHGNRSNNTN